MGILSSKQVKLASALIKESGYLLKEFSNRNVLKLQNGRAIIYIYPKN